MRKLPALIFGSVVVLAAYSVSGYFAIRAMSATLLIDLCLYPEDIAKQWIAVPFKKVLAQHALYSKTAGEIQGNFRLYGYTLYSGVMGYRAASAVQSVPRTPHDAKLLREIASLVHRSGVGLDWVDGAGCTAIHQALLESDVSSATFLMELGTGEQLGPNPAASYKPCRLDIASLALQRGLSIK